MVKKAATTKEPKVEKPTSEQPSSEEEALKVAKELGVDIDAILESRVAKAVNKVLTDSHLAEIVPVMQTKIDATDKKLTDLTALLTSLAEKAQAGQASLAQVAPGAQGSDGMALLAALIKGGQGGGGGDDFFEKMIKYQTAAAAMWQNPLAQAIQMVTTMQKGSYGIGLSTEQVIKGTESLLGKPAEPKSNT
jgi:hypothetical protein